MREVIRSVRSARAAEPDLGAEAILDLLEINTGVPRRLIETAIPYWSAFPDEIDRWIEDVETLEAESLASWQRRQDLLRQ